MTTMYRYTEGGLDNIYLVNGFHYHDTPYGVGVSIDDVDGLHQAIALDLCRGKKLLAPKEFRFIRKQLELAQEGLALLLGCTGQTVARWEKGENDIPGAADRLVRLLYVEQAKGSAHVRELVELLKDLDALWHEERIFRMDDNWRPAA